MSEDQKHKIDFSKIVRKVYDTETEAIKVVQPPQELHFSLHASQDSVKAFSPIKTICYNLDNKNPESELIDLAGYNKVAIYAAVREGLFPSKIDFFVSPDGTGQDLFLQPKLSVNLLDKYSSPEPVLAMAGKLVVNSDADFKLSVYVVLGT